MKHYNSVLRLDMIVISYLVHQLEEGKIGLPSKDINKQIRRVKKSMINFSRLNESAVGENFSYIDKDTEDSEAVEKAHLVSMDQVLNILHSTDTFSVYHDFRSTPEDPLYVICGNTKKYERLDPKSKEALILNYYAHPSEDDNLTRLQEDILFNDFGIRAPENKLESGTQCFPFTDCDIYENSRKICEIEAVASLLKPAEDIPDKETTPEEN